MNRILAGFLLAILSFALGVLCNRVFCTQYAMATTSSGLVRMHTRTGKVWVLTMTKDDKWQWTVLAEP